MVGHWSSAGTVLLVLCASLPLLPVQLCPCLQTPLNASKAWLTTARLLLPDMLPNTRLQILASNPSPCIHHPCLSHTCGTRHTRDALAAEGKAHLVEAMLLAIERVWGYRFEDGLNPDLDYLHHLQVRVRPPCCWQLGGVAWVVGWCSRAAQETQ